MKQSTKILACLAVVAIAFAFTACEQGTGTPKQIASLAAGLSGEAEAEYWLAVGLMADKDQKELLTVTGAKDTTTGEVQDPGDAAVWLQKAALQGHVLAALALGNVLSQPGYTKYGWYDPPKAAYWYEFAAFKGNAQAQYALGNCYLEGTGVEVDREMAIFWFELSESNGFGPAMAKLAKLR